MNGCEVPSHFVSGTEWPQLKLGAPWGKSKRSFPRSCSVSLPPLFLITSLKPHRSSGSDSISFRIPSLLTLNISLSVREGCEVWKKLQRLAET